jgi:hypothetical protein
MENVLTEAYNDAVVLADAATNTAANNMGFTHYFGGNGAATQLQNFNSMMNLVANGVNIYAVEFNCVDSSNRCAPKLNQPSAMYTDVLVGGPNDFKTITACPQFWTSGTTRYLLGTSSSSTIGGPPIAPSKTSPNAPYRPRDNTNPGWCTKRREGNDPNPSAWKTNRYATAGTTILHELTHLDALGRSANLIPDQANQHGTGDAQKNCEFVGARQFLQVCGFSQLRPFT